MPAAAAAYPHFHAPNDEKRMVVLPEEKDIEPWRDAGAGEAASFIRQLPADMLTARPEPREARARE